MFCKSSPPQDRPVPRFKIIPEVHLFLERDGRLLMLRRFNTGFAFPQSRARS
jgi:hypothetical protein